ncbi:MAG: four helix bundle protein [Phycisphaerae bacterium]|nr:four helix bundle protein [Phycisphaerae bacterium]
MEAKPYDLAERTFLFAKEVREFTQQYPRNHLKLNDIQQLIRSSGSVGANYIEANEALGKKDFRMRIKISRKEAKESEYWLKLLKTDDSESESMRAFLEKEAKELTLIFSAILQRSQTS